MTHLEGEEGALGRENQPLLCQDGPRPAPPGSTWTTCKHSEDTPVGRFLGLCLPGSCPPGTGARLQRPPADGEGKGHAPVHRGEAKENQDGDIVQERISPWARQSLACPGAATRVSQSPSLGITSLFPASCRALAWMGRLPCWFGKCALADGWWPQPMDWGTPAWLWGSWSPSTGTGLSLPPATSLVTDGEDGIEALIVTRVTPCARPVPRALPALPHLILTTTPYDSHCNLSSFTNKDTQAQESPCYIQSHTPNN